jgi:hypothetical protein
MHEKIIENTRAKIEEIMQQKQKLIEQHVQIRIEKMISLQAHHLHAFSIIFQSRVLIKYRQVT